VEKSDLKTRNLILGIIGSVCFGIGDWLLGFVDTGSIGQGVFYFLQEGHGANYGMWKAAVVLLLAGIGVAPLYPGLKEIAKIVGDGKSRSCLEFLSVMTLAGFILLHLIVTFHVAAFSSADKISREFAVTVDGELNSVTCPVFVVAYILIFASFILMPVYILKGKTKLKKSAVIFTPAVPMALVCLVAAVIPTSAFSYGLFTFCINFGLQVWLIYLLVIRSKIIKLF